MSGGKGRKKLKNSTAKQPIYEPNEHQCQKTLQQHRNLVVQMLKHTLFKSVYDQ